MQNNPLDKFTHEFSREVFIAERFRLYIIAAIFAIIGAYLLFLVVVFEDWLTQVFRGQNPILWLLILVIFIALRSLIVLRVWSKWYKKRKRIPRFLRYLNAALEISLPTLAIIVLSISLPSVILLHTPAVFLYFLFIILSIFELDAKICLFSGTLAAAEYLILVYFFTGNPEIYSGLEMQALNYPYIYIGKALLLFVAGILASLVTRQINNKILNLFNTSDERNRIEKLFGQQVSAEVVDELMNSDYQINPRQRFVCIMFLDIRGYTTLAEGKRPDEIIKFQNDVFGFMIDIINKHHGIINQFLGDGFMATFGAPVSKENDCQNTIDAAINIERAMQNHIQRGEIPDIKIGIGIHAGEAVTGNVGTATRKQYSVTGNVVILASRIEQLNKQYGSTILISQEVVDRIHLPENSLSSLGPVHIRGRTKAVELYQVHALAE